MSSTDFVPIGNDGKLKKCIIREGKGAKAHIGEKIAINYQVEDFKGTIIKSTYLDNKPEIFVLTKDENKLLTTIVLTMKGGEKSKILLEENSPETVLNYIVEFLYIIEPMQISDAISQAEELNKLAGDSFRAKNFQNAESLYKEAISILVSFQSDEIKALLLKLRSNLSMVYSKVFKWNESLHWAEYVLRDDKANPKCMLRKLDALIQLGQLNTALQFSQFCLENSNNDPVFVNKRKEIEKAVNSSKNQQDDVYRRMFGKK